MQSAMWKANRPIWDRVTQCVKHAVVYIDTKIAEFLHWSGGLQVLVSAGAVDVRELSSFESAEDSQKKCVFMVSSLLEGVTADIIQDIVTQSHFQYAIVMTTMSPLLHAGFVEWDDSDDRDFPDFEDQVLEWMGNMNYTVQVQHIPLFGAEICPGVFVTPAFTQLYPLMASDVKQISHQYTAAQATWDSKQLGNLEEVECHHLPLQIQAQIKSLASGLHAFLQILDVREDVYSMGHTARLVATELESYPPAKLRRKACQNRSSLIVVDRSLDISAAVSHQTDTLMDRLTNTLSPLPRHCTDRKVDMRPLCHVIQNGLSESTILCGSLATANPAQSPSHLMPLIFKKQKEALMDVNRKLVEIAAAEKLPLDMSSRPGRVTPDVLESTVALFKGKYPIISKHIDMLQIAVATSQALKHSKSALWDTMVAKEKNIVQALGEDTDMAPSGLSIVSKIIMEESAKVKKERNLDLDEIFCLLTFLYSVSDGDCGEEDEAQQIRDQLADWILTDKNDLPPFTKHILGDTVTESILADQIESVWDKLVAVGDARSNMNQFRSVLDPGNTLSPAQLKPLLRQVMERIVDPVKSELPDIECKTGGFKDLLKSGFGFFKGSGKPRPGDAPLLILYVIGGITANEIKQIRQVVDKAKPGFEVLIGSSHLSSIDQTMRSLLVDDNININNM